MKKLLKPFLLISIIFFAVACSDSDDDVAPPLDDNTASNLRTTVSDEIHSTQMQDLMADSTLSDPFTLKSAVIDTVKQELYIEVQYSGGCAQHDFELIWPENIIAVFPPVYPIILNHEDNGDMCEALPTETLVIDLTDKSLGFNQFTINNMIVEVINGSNKNEVVRTDK